MAADPVLSAVYSTFAEEGEPSGVANADVGAGQDDRLTRYSKGLWRGVLCVEGTETGDYPRREFSPNALEWRELPLSLYWQSVTAMGHDNAMIVASIDSIRRSGAAIHGHGRFDLGGEHGDEAHRLIHGRFMRGVSVTVDDTEDADIELVFPEPAEGDEGDDELMMDLFAMPEKVIFHHARIMDACLTGQPALQEAFIELVPDDLEHLVDSDEPLPEEALAAGGPLAPPLDWFKSRLTGPTPATFEDNGRCYGHLATWGTCHTSFGDTCVTPPRAPKGDYGYFMKGELRTGEGVAVNVGQLTLGANHAPARLGAAPAASHYEHTGHAAADVAVGEDEWGIWFAGATRPEVSEPELRVLRASGVSGDWRKVRGQWRLVGALMVNVPGFPIPRVRTYVHNGEQRSLVAAGVLRRGLPKGALPLSLAHRIAKSIGRDPESRAKALHARVHPSQGRIK